jgi:ATP-binding cassette subfamily B protein
MVRPDASDEALIQALRSVGAHERLAGRALGLSAPVGARGALLSSGERQLLGLARVALLSADVLIFDEATSSIDPGMELVVNRALEHLMHERTVVVVAHRLSTMQRVDRIVLLAEGSIAEIGAHAELIAQNGQYAALYREWLHTAALGETQRHTA